MRPQTTAKRLLLVAEKLESLPPDRFDYHRWVGSDWKGKQDLSCGTTACALGWAATLPELQALGLRLRKHMGTSDGEDFVTLKGKRAIRYGRLRNTLSHSLEAASEVFGISEEQAEYLFTNPNFLSGMGAWVPTPSRVAQHIRDFVKELPGVHSPDTK